MLGQQLPCKAGTIAKQGKLNSTVCCCYFEHSRDWMRVGSWQYCLQASEVQEGSGQKGHITSLQYRRNVWYYLVPHPRHCNTTTFTAGLPHSHSLSMLLPLVERATDMQDTHVSPLYEMLAGYVYRIWRSTVLCSRSTSTLQGQKYTTFGTSSLVL